MLWLATFLNSSTTLSNHYFKSLDVLVFRISWYSFYILCFFTLIIPRLSLSRCISCRRSAVKGQTYYFSYRSQTRPRYFQTCLAKAYDRFCRFKTTRKLDGFNHTHHSTLNFRSSGLDLQMFLDSSCYSSWFFKALTKMTKLWLYSRFNHSLLFRSYCIVKPQLPSEVKFFWLFSSPWQCLNELAIK